MRNAIYAQFCNCSIYIMFNASCAMCNIPCAMLGAMLHAQCYVQCSTCSAQCCMCNVACTMLHVQCCMCNVACAMLHVQCNVACVNFRVQCVMSIVRGFGACMCTCMMYDRLVRRYLDIDLKTNTDLTTIRHSHNNKQDIDL